MLTENAVGFHGDLVPLAAQAGLAEREKKETPWVRGDAD